MSFTLPHQEVEVTRQMIKKTENYTIEQPMWPEPATYFNNPKRRTSTNLYDAIMNRVQGYNQKAHRDDRQDLNAIHENVFQQEKDKWIPVLTSLQYARPKMVFYDVMGAKYNKTNCIQEFFSRFGVNMAPDEDKSAD